MSKSNLPREDKKKKSVLGKRPRDKDDAEKKDSSEATEKIEGTDLFTRRL